MVLLDTNILSELLKPAPDARVSAWIASQDARHVFTSVITEAEGLYGLALLPDGRRQKLQRQAFLSVFDNLFVGRILPFDRAAAAHYAEIAAMRRKRGRPISQSDAMIAAIALANDLTLATRNMRDFELIDLRVINPFEYGADA